MRRTFFLLKILLYLKAPIAEFLLFGATKCCKNFTVLPLAAVLTPLIMLAQQPIPGIRANGKIINQGDVLTTCVGSKIIYESTAQNYDTIRWRFNNGTPGLGISNYQNITYSFAGIDTAWQTVIAGAEKDSIFLLVRVTDIKPVAGFNFLPNNDCGNVPVNFTNTSSGTGLSYFWSFGDGGTSTQTDPAYQFLNATGISGTQNYNVKLLVTNNLNCSDSITNVVTVKKIPDASVANGGSPDVIFGPFNGRQTFRRCTNLDSYSFKFVNAGTTPSIITKYTIQWGDGAADSVFATWPSGTIISHVFPKGISLMKVIAEGSNGCTGIKTYDVFLGTTPAGSLGNNGNNSICAPNSLTFPVYGSANNAPGTTYKFYVNDGTASEVFQHPPPDNLTHIFTVGSCGNYSNSYSNAFIATLFIENPCGSTTSPIVPLYVSGKPRAFISVSPSNNVCTNSPLTIINSSNFGGQITPTGGVNSTCKNEGKQVWKISPSSGYSVTPAQLGDLKESPGNSSAWRNGASYLNLSFNIAGTYTIKLYAGNEYCGVDSITKTICVRNPPQASFTLNRRSVCGTTTEAITNTSTTEGCLGDSYKWDITYTDPQNCGNAQSFGFANNTNAFSKDPVINFISAGRYIIKLTVTGNGTANRCQPSFFQDTFWVKAIPKTTLNAVTAICVGNTIAPTAAVTNCYADSSASYFWEFVNGSPANSSLPVPGNVLYNLEGTFPVILNSANECGTDRDTIQAIVTSTPAADAGVDTQTCSGFPIQIGAPLSPGLTYEWSPATGLSNPNISAPAATISYNGLSADTTLRYVVKVLAGTNCSGSDTVFITVKKNPVVNVFPAVSSVCLGSATQLIASGGDSYTWAPVAGLDVSDSDAVVASPAATTIYNVTGTLANGCSSTASAAVSVTPYPLVNAGADTLVCNNTAAVQITGSPTGGTWSGNAFISSAGVFNPRAAGIGVYTIYYSATNGSCSATDSALITVTYPPVANAGNDTLICQGSTSTILTGAPAGGTWSGSTLVSQSGQFTPSMPGDYRLVYTIGGGSCIATDTVTVTVSAGITNNIITGNQSICTATQPLIITGQPATGGSTAPSYQWQLSTDSINWNIIPSEINKDYTPGILTQTIWYRRIASTSLCFGTEANYSLPIKITVNPDATAQFNPAIHIGCAPFTLTPAVINLTEFSSVGEYKWFVNEIYIGSGQNFPGYTMNNSGDSITVKLRAISKYGCKNDSVQHSFTTVQTPVPSFTVSDSVGCGPLTITVNNTTAVVSDYSYQWNFGQGQTSSLARPGSIIFPVNPNYGDTVYTITLKTISLCNTIVTSHSVKVRAHPQVLFTPDKTEGCSPLQVTFNNTGRGSNASYMWDFDDGSKSSTNNASVQHTFNAGQVTAFHVKLKGTNDCGSDSLIYTIVVNPNTIKVDFAVNGNERIGCTPHTVHFINNTIGATNFTWNFGDGATLNTAKGIDTITHTYTSAGNFNINLSAANGCSDTSDIEPITVQIKPVVGFSVNSLESCIKDTVRFTNTSDAGISNLWRFGDGTTSVNRDPAKAFPLPGTYHVSLTGSRSFNQGLSCSDSAFADIIIRDTLPGNMFVSDSVGGCIPFSVTFKNSDGSAKETSWSFSDGSTVTGNIITHTFTAAGVYSITMISHGNSGCTFKAVKTIRVAAPVGDLLYAGGFICSGNTARFEARATGASQYRFVFGDGDSVTTSNPVVFHEYLNPGEYIPYAYLANGNCDIKVSTGDTIKVDKIIAGFNITQQFNCGTTDVKFADTSYAYFGLQSRHWNFGDGTSSNLQNPVKTYLQSTGDYVELSVTGISGCTGTVTVPVSISVRNFPVSDISADSTACTAQPFAMAALVVSDNAVNSYSWNFGNNTTASGRNANAAYNVSGNYTIRLIVATIYGCADTVYKTIRVNETPIVSAGANVLICKGQTVQLQAFGATSWQWSPLQNLSCSTCANPLASPSLNTLYTVKGTNSAGCSMTDTLLAEVAQPVNLTISANDTICTGDRTQLFASGAAQYSWSPAADLNNISAPNPVAQPAVTTQYQVIGKDDYNCFADTAFVTVAVGQYPVVDLGTGSLVVAGTQVAMNPIFTNGPFKNYAWTPVTNLSCSDCAQPVTTINTNSSYKLTAENIYGCKGSDTINYTVTCQEAAQLYVPNAFSPDGDGLNDVLMVRGKGLAMVKYFRIFNRWGQLVFERNNAAANDISQGWDGKVNNVHANPDVYVYTVEVVCTGGSVFVKKGNVTLFR